MLNTPPAGISQAAVGQEFHANEERTLSWELAHSAQSCPAQGPGFDLQDPKCNKSMWRWTLEIPELGKVETGVGCPASLAYLTDSKPLRDPISKRKQTRRCQLKMSMTAEVDLGPHPHNHICVHSSHVHLCT